MADQLKTDILMKFVLEGNPVWGECAAQKDPKDDFMKEFNPSSSAEDYSDFFQVEKFDFGVQIKDSDKSSSKASKQAAATTVKVGTKGGDASKGGLPFMAWRTASEDELESGDQDKNYQLTFEEFNFTRQVDSASPIFFQGCCRNTTFERAILVKRFSIDDKRLPIGFLQIIFEKILFTGVTWDDGDVLNEACKFICQKVTISYKQQDDDGTLRLTSEPVVWDWEKDSKRSAEGTK